MKLRCASLVSLAVVLGGGVVWGDEFAAENFRPASPGDAELFGVQTATLPAPGQLAFGVTVGFADDPLVVMDGDRRVAEVIDDRFAATLAAAYSFGRLELSAGIPMVLSQRGDQDAMLGLSGVSSGGVGDVQLGGRGRILGDGRRGLSVLAAIELSIPTGDGAEFGGDAAVSGGGLAVAEWRTGPLVLSFNAGARLRKTQSIGDLEVGSAALLGAGAAFAPPALGGVSLVGELAGEIGGADQAELPFEARGGLRWTHSSGLTAAAAYGHGLTHGYAAPGHRVLFTLAFRGARPEPPRPLVAIPAPSVPAPDPDPDSDGDGLVDAADRCPDRVEDVDGFEDDDGCPDADNDGDGLADADDRCPDAAEIINGVEDDDGCPDAGEQLVVVGARRIEIREMIHFATGKAEIRKRSAVLLDQLATTLIRHRWIHRVEIGGHTDSRGNADYNLDLSRRRVAAVRAALVTRGVTPERLEPVGYGETQPIDTNRTVRGRAHNRRVEFLILEHDPEHPAARRAAQRGDQP